MFIQNIATKPEGKTDDGNTIRTVLLFKDQIAANAVRRRLRDLSNKVAATLYSLVLWAKNSSTILSQKKLSRVL